MKRRRALLFTATVVLILCGACGVWLHFQQQQYARNRQLIDALMHSDTRQALALVNEGADPNTPMIQPALPPPELLWNQLLHHAPQPVTDGPTALRMVCGTSWHPLNAGRTFPITLEENLPLLQAMLSRGAITPSRTLHVGTALHDAVIVDRLPTVELLLQHGANVNAQDIEGQTPLTYAVRKDTANMARLLLTHGANPNVQDNHGDAALQWAVLSPIAETLIPELLAHGADLDQRNKKGVTPLQSAQKRKRPDLIRLLTRGAK